MGMDSGWEIKVLVPRYMWLFIIAAVPDGLRLADSVLSKSR